jgi:hypothetical protein
MGAMRGSVLPKLLAPMPNSWILSGLFINFYLAPNHSKCGTCLKFRCAWPNLRYFNFKLVIFRPAGTTKPTQTSLSSISFVWRILSQKLGVCYTFLYHMKLSTADSSAYLQQEKWYITFLTLYVPEVFRVFGCFQDCNCCGVNFLFLVQWRGGSIHRNSE